MSPRRVLALARKDLRLLLRDRSAVVLTFLWPLVIAVFFGALTPQLHEGPSAIRVLLVQPEDPGLARAAELLRNTVELECVDTEFEAGRRAVAVGTAPAMVQLNHNGERVEVRLTTDPGQPVAAALIEARVEARLDAGLRDGPSPVTVTREEAGSGPRIRPPSPFAVTFPQGMVWALLGCVASFAVALALEMREGSLDRVLATPARPLEPVLGRTLAAVSAMVVVQGALLGVGIFAFGLRPVRPGALVVVLVAAGLGFAGLTQLVAALARSARSVGGLTWAVLLGLAMLGGAMLPLVLMPPWLGRLAMLSPVAWVLVGVEGTLWRGSDASELGLVIAALVLLGTASMGLAARRLRPA